MECPSCGKSMTTKKYESVNIDECTGCHGVWLDDNELALIIQDTSQDFTPDERVKAYEMKGRDHHDSHNLSCPKCSATLRVIQYAYNSGVFIDHCPHKHGVWLDPGELSKIQIYMEQILELHKKNPESLSENRRIENGKICPRDGTKLQEVKYETETIDVCECCQGVWFDDDELSKIIRSREKVFEEDQFSDIKAEENAANTREVDLSILPCVKCGAPMKSINFSYSSGIMIDRCSKGHGVWLDHHELERIQIFVERWEAKSPQISNNYSKKIQTAKAEAAMAYDRAVSEGRWQGLEGSLLGKFLKKVM